MQKGLANKGLANLLVNLTVEMQGKMSALLTKLDADNSGALDVNYSITLAVDESFAPTDQGTDAPYKASWRRALRSALKHKRAADEILDVIDELQVVYNALLLKLDSQTGTLTDTNFASLLTISPLTGETELVGANRASLQRILEVSIAHKNIANSFYLALLGLQEQINGTLAQLDIDGSLPAAALLGNYSPLQNNILDPDV